MPPVPSCLGERQPGEAASMPTRLPLPTLPVLPPVQAPGPMLCCPSRKPLIPPLLCPAPLSYSCRGHSCLNPWPWPCLVQCPWRVGGNQRAQALGTCSPGDSVSTLGLRQPALWGCCGCTYSDVNRAWCAGRTPQTAARAALPPAQKSPLSYWETCALFLSLGCLVF